MSYHHHLKTTGKKIEKKMIKTKVRQNFSINREISNKFKEVCDSKSINMSKLIENMIREFITKNSESNDQN
jgi:hypothetical protein